MTITVHRVTGLIIGQTRECRDCMAALAKPMHVCRRCGVGWWRLATSTKAAKKR